MAIVLKNSRYNLKLDSKTIIGVMGKGYDEFLMLLKGVDVYYLDNRVIISNKRVYEVLNANDIIIKKIVDGYNLDDNFANKYVNELSHSEQKLLKYILLMFSDKKVIIIDEPFLDLDYDNKKKVQLLINKLVNEKRTVILGSVDSNIIYSLCKKVLFINKDKYYYGDVTAFQNSELLKKYRINPPSIVNFVSLARNKGIKLRYSYDIRDLIKDVYRNVSQK